MNRIEKISVILPVIDTAVSSLQACLRSVGFQTLHTDEYEVVIVVPAAVSAECHLEVSEFATRNDNASVVELDTPLDVARARKAGLCHSSGDYVLFLACGDLLASTALERLRGLASRERAELACCSTLQWCPDTAALSTAPSPPEMPRGGFEDRLLALFEAGNATVPGGWLVKRHLLTDAILASSVTDSGEDPLLACRIMAAAGTAACTSEPLYFRLRDRSVLGASEWADRIGQVFLNVDGLFSLADQEGMRDRAEQSILAGMDRTLEALVLAVLHAQNLTAQEKRDALQLVAAQRLRIPGRADRNGSAFIDRFLVLFKDEDGHDAATALDELSKLSVKERAAVGVTTDTGQAPSGYARLLKGKLVFVADVDYQLRNAADLARTLGKMGVECVILDNSCVASGGKRQLPRNEQSLFDGLHRIVIREREYALDWLSGARIVLLFNDWNPQIQAALEYRRLLGLPVMGCVEGISDFLRVDFSGYHAYPYRRCDRVLLAGEADREYFPDRDVAVVGMPVVERLVARQVLFPDTPKIALNVNFTYSSLEWCRPLFVRTALDAIEALGLEYAITQHPSDGGALEEFTVTKLTQYELIDASSIFVSRFATGIIEALAMGKPVIYFNPHGEKVTKFSEPLDAFRIADSADSLKLAIQETLAEIASGVDFRERASAFLALHAGLHSGRSSAARLMDCLHDGYWHAAAARERGNALFLGRLTGHSGSEAGDNDSSIFGADFCRRDGALFNEEDFIAACLEQREGTLIDVGANYGKVSATFVAKGWEVHAFEPDPDNRAELLKNLSGSDRLRVNDNAVSNVSGKLLPFYASKESTGISSLSAFTKGHVLKCEVTTTTLSDYMASHAIQAVDFLKVDVEGHDKFVLEGFPWAECTPRVILVEFEDRKTVSNGYDAHDLAVYLEERGYQVWVSEWLPILRYGPAHDWRRLVKYASTLDLAGGWGNFIAFSTSPAAQDIRRMALDTIAFKPGTARIAGTTRLGKLAWQSRVTVRRLARACALQVAAVIRRLAKTDRGARLKQRLEAFYDRHVGRS